MAYIWRSSSSHETPRQQDIILTYTDCQFDHNLDIPHDCIYDLETCGLFEPSGPRGSPEFSICAACHYPRNSHPRVTSTPLHHIMAHSQPRPYYPAHQGEASTWHAPEMTHSPLHQPVRNLTPDRSERLRAIAKKNNYKALKDYTKAEAKQICAELGIKRRCFRDWIYRHNLARQRAARERAAAKEEADREAAEKEAAANEEAAR